MQLWGGGYIIPWRTFQLPITVGEDDESGVSGQGVGV